MPKKVVPLVTGEKYHIYNRGVDKRIIFNDKEDYLRFYQSLKFFNTIDPNINYRLAKFRFDSNRPRLVSIEAYSLLPNHFHLILKQQVDGGISEFMKRVSVGFVGYFNEKYSRSGSLFEGGFKRVHIDTDKYDKYLFAYVNENHLVHNYTNDIEICHSSSLHYRNIKKSLLIDNRVEYDYQSAIEIVKDIYKRREQLKPLTLE